MGKWVIYQHFQSGVGGSIWRIPVEGGTPTKISEAYAIRPIVSPDGNWIACWYSDKHQNSIARLAVIPFAGGAPTKIFEVPPTVQVSWDTPIRWAADSRSLTYVDQRGGVDNLLSQPIEGGPAKQVTDFKDGRIFSFDWSRDGRLLASRGALTTDVVLISEVR